jgi:hypothetical protein
MINTEILTWLKWGLVVICLFVLIGLSAFIVGKINKPETTEPEVVTEEVTEEEEQTVIKPGNGQADSAISISPAMFKFDL